MLPILGYSASWAVKDGDGNKPADVGSRVARARGGTNNSSELTAKRRRPRNRANHAARAFPPPTQNVTEWELYVDAVVSHYLPKYNISYYQIWNEPTTQAGFWHGANNSAFVPQVYLPAAKIVRARGGRVVFGGWPASNSIDEFNQILNTSQVGAAAGRVAWMSAAVDIWRFSPAHFSCSLRSTVPLAAATGGSGVCADGRH